MKHSIELATRGRESLKLELEVDAHGEISHSILRGVGHRAFLKEIDAYRGQIKGALNGLMAPSGNSIAAMMLHEGISRLQGKWNPPIPDEEICHCRNVLFKTIDQAIVAGAHTSEKVSAWTSASTACGTCRPSVESHLRFRLRASS